MDILVIPMFFAALTCSEPKIFNKSDIPWNDEDQRTLEYNIREGRCKTHFKELICIAEIYKLGVRNYYIRCGKPE